MKSAWGPRGSDQTIGPACAPINRLGKKALFHPAEGLKSHID
jgi:hypothetical protein